MHIERALGHFNRMEWTCFFFAHILNYTVNTHLNAYVTNFFSEGPKGGGGGGRYISHFPNPYIVHIHPMSPSIVSSNSIPSVKNVWPNSLPGDSCKSHFLSRNLEKKTSQFHFTLFSVLFSKPGTPLQNILKF